MGMQWVWRKANRFERCSIPEALWMEPDLFIHSFFLNTFLLSDTELTKHLPVFGQSGLPNLLMLHKIIKYFNIFNSEANRALDVKWLSELWCDAGRQEYNQNELVFYSIRVYFPF